MCYNCGCGLPDDPMGKKRVTEGGSSLTDKDFEKMAKDWDMRVEEAKWNTFETLRGEFVRSGKVKK